MNIYDISKEAGVSIATVSRVLNNSKNVSPKTRAKIQAIIDANNFSATKPGKKHRYNKTVGILCSGLTNPRTATIVEALTFEFNKLGYYVLLSCEDNLSNKKTALMRLVESNPTAIIIEGIDYLAYDNADNNYVLQAANDFPIIILNSYLEHPNIHSILCDEKDLIFSITEDLIKQNRTQNVFLFSSLSSYCAPLIDAFNHAYFVHNIETAAWQQHLCHRNTMDAYNYIDNLIKSGKKIDGIITTNDYDASMAQKVLLDNNLLDTTEIFGMGNSHLAAACNIPSINCKDFEIATAAINTFKGIINNTHTPSRITIPAELKKRRT